MKVAKIALPGQVIWHHTDLLAKPNPDLFDPGWLHETGRLTGRSIGRNTAWFLHHKGRDMVLRHYWRGGMAGRLLNDLHLRKTVANSRAMREFTLLNWMHRQNLPTPRAVAARFRPMGPWYRADLLMERITDAQALADLLTERALRVTDWIRIGAVIARMHAFGVHHSDLNCRNILLNGARQVWLIDFDKCKRRRPGRWLQQNLERLERSLIKEKNKRPDLNWSDQDWVALLEGYRLGPDWAKAT